MSPAFMPSRREGGLRRVLGLAGGAAVALLLGLTLTACGGAEGNTAASRSTKAASETPSATPTTATEAQVASVVAGYKKEWRKVINGAFDCRFDLTMGESDPSTELGLMSCYTREVTAGMTAESAINDLNALSVPDSMTSLVDETETALQAVADVDLEAICGPAMSVPKDSDKCSGALGERNLSYSELGTALDKWSPYL